MIRQEEMTKDLMGKREWERELKRLPVCWQSVDVRLFLTLQKRTASRRLHLNLQTKMTVRE